MQAFMQGTRRSIPPQQQRRHVDVREELAPRDVTAGNRGPGRWLEVQRRENRSSGGDAGGGETADLTLERAADGSEHYEILDEARNVVGHIMLSDAAPPEMPWIWTVASGPHTGRKSTHGYEATREAAMEAFAKVWHRE
jgi:hypothetical protein